MHFICADREWIAISNGSRLLVFGEISNREITLELPPARPPVKENKPAPKVAPDDTKNTFLGMQFSCCGRWLAAYSSAKQLLIWEAKEWSLISERYMPKTASSMKFTPDSQAIVIVDKAGDAVLFSTQDLQKEGEVILGHLSMLLDVLLTPDGKQIITCDRDEKVRVSQFPNAYNIISYCLGHKEFVSSISLLPHNTSILLSASGDGTMRLWNYSKGLALSSYDCSSDVVKHLKVDTSPHIQLEEGKPSSIIVSKICCHKVADDTSIVFALFYGFQGYLVYRITDENIAFVHAELSNMSVLDLCVRDTGELLVRVAKGDNYDVVHCFSFDSCTNSLRPSVNSLSFNQMLKKINAVFKLLDNQSVTSSNVPQLLKRKFDNVKDYYEQKKARIGEQ
ncbi:tRNA (guanine-N(7)-)-methyltransferase non-catalytic subunit WDR4 [Frankliniella fusca]|uniref:tRNA (Guanine-N(7)-)-methyltransferase non-catalytic subunit WDR4 n=1 Tax=Frankliniella fusca TaxID=407009 RepID=A0AAE1LPH8_9NEOP|nr:tRNA (guanine-N(7)-)-methyltransferase non-catalytic subunit WDR4 [Frankliniella fusca]